MRKPKFLVMLAVAVCAGTFSACNKELDQTISSSTSVSLPQKVSGDLTLAKSNWNTNVGSLVTLKSFNVSGTVQSTEAKETLIGQILADDALAANGNILDNSSMKIGTVADFQTQNPDLKNTLHALLEQQINVGDVVVNVSWQSAQKSFVSKCIVHNDAIVWDNLLTNTIMMDEKPIEAQSQSPDVAGSTNNKAAATQAKVYSAWYSYYQYWTLNWIWGSERGKVSYTIKIYCYSNGYVYNTDNSDSGYMDLGSSRSESKILVNSGSYGKIQYALGLATPTGSLSFDKSGFKVSFSGLGSNLVENGTKSLTPW